MHVFGLKSLRPARKTAGPDFFRMLGGGGAMKIDELGTEHEKTLLLLPGTCCDWQTNFGTVLDALSAKYQLVCVNYDGFDGTGSVFDSVISQTEKIEAYLAERHGGKVDGALGSSLGGSFAAQLVLRQNVHIKHAIMGSCDFDQCCPLAAKIQTALAYPLLSGAAKQNKNGERMRRLLVSFFEMDEETAQKFMQCFAKFSPKSILNEYYTDLITCLPDGISVPGTKVHIIYALKMGKKYGRRYKKYFRDPDIREFAMQHEAWLFGERQWEEPVLAAIDGWMGGE